MTNRALLYWIFVNEKFFGGEKNNEPNPFFRLGDKETKRLEDIRHLMVIVIFPVSQSSTLKSLSLLSPSLTCWFFKHMLHRAWWNHGVYLWEISIQAVALGSSYNLDNYIFWVVFWNLQKRRNNAWHKSVRYPCDDCVLLSHCALG